MDYNIITQIVSAVGFPIAACVAMAYFINNKLKELSICIENLDKTLIKIDTRIQMITDNMKEEENNERN